MKYAFFAGTLLLFLCSGCYFKQFSNVEKAQNIRVGMTKEEVFALMGEPEDVELSSEDLWFYFVRSKWHDGMITEDECLPIVFVDGRVAGWGNRFYATYRLEEKNFYRPEAYGDIQIPESPAPVSLADRVAQKEEEGDFTVPGERE